MMAPPARPARTMPGLLPCAAGGWYAAVTSPDKLPDWESFDRDAVFPSKVGARVPLACVRVMDPGPLQCCLTGTPSSPAGWGPA